MFLNKIGTLVFIYINEWHEYCRDKGIENPYEKKLKIINNTYYQTTTTLFDKEIPCTKQRELTSEEAAMLPTQEECANFKRDEENFIASKLINDLTWEEFIIYCTITRRTDLIDIYNQEKGEQHESNL